MISATGGRFRTGSASSSSRYWTVIAFLIALPVMGSLLMIVLSLFYPDAEVMQHLLRFVLLRITWNTLLLVVGVSLLAGAIGVVLGWITAMYELPGRRFFNWALLLPMAVPGYVMAFVVVGLFEYAGPVQSLLREWFGPEIWFPHVQSRPGLVVVMSLALYP
ncbi:MAG: iron ABC transporter permease, partial [Gammaproteobacteria bacterium]|nr:iron ABC transporter permease [Gammaproteobacteria bacterium]